MNVIIPRLFAAFAWGLICGALALSTVRGQEAPAISESFTDDGDNVAALIERTGKSHSREQRLAAINQLKSLRGKAALPAMEALSRAAADADVEIRKAALLRLAEIAFLNDGECPMAVVRALCDENLEVRETAATHLYFENYPRAAFAELLQAAQHTDLTSRSAALDALRFATYDQGTRDQAVARLKEALSDSRFLIRNNAAVGLWQLTHDPALVLPHHLRYVAGNLGDDEAAALKNLLQESYAKRLEAMAVLFPEDVARGLHAGLSSDDRRMQGNCLAQIRKLAPVNGVLESECRRRGVPQQLQSLSQDSDPDIAKQAKGIRRELEWTKAPRDRSTHSPPCG